MLCGNEPSALTCAGNSTLRLVLETPAQHGRSIGGVSSIITGIIFITRVSGRRRTWGVTNNIDEMNGAFGQVTGHRICLKRHQH
ncbi:MAG: hypothetical protein IPP29_20810 [Bacteroidetes bacterium]|nr:hypothetical protein [Bacteroidota bacterium]